MEIPFSTTIFYYAVIGEEKVRYPAQTVIGGDSWETFTQNMGEFFSTLASRFDEDGNPAFVTFEPRELSPNRGPGAPLPDAPKNVPKCPIHGVALKEKTNRTTGQKFFSCGERNPQGGYCNWKPSDQK